MSHWFDRHRPEPASAPVVPSGGQPWLQTPLTPGTIARLRDPNAPDYRYQVNQKCIYERRLPGGSYITAHVQRLQSGFYDSPVIHEDLIENVRFVAINFVFHPSRSTFRFKSAEINIAIHHTRDGDKNSLPSFPGMAPPRHSSHDHGTQTETVTNALVRSTDILPRSGSKPSRPKFLRHAPHLLYGAISPETLNWDFNLAGSLGVSQGPANATFQPSYGMKSSYKIYEMMKIQGSVRTLRSWYGHEYDIEDGEMVWTLEENKLQKSGLPREFTFVMLLTKGSGGYEDSGDVKLDIDVHPKVAGRLGASYPSLVTNLHQYRPFKNGMLDLDQEIGQVFEPHIKGRGFNFANIASSFDDFVFLPGTTYSTSDTGGPQSPNDGSAKLAAPAQKPPQQGARPGQTSAKGQTALPAGNTTLNLRVFLETSRGSPIPFPLQVQSLPYLNLKPPSRNPSRTPSPLPASVAGSRNSTRRTITISSTKSLRKQRSRSELSREFTESPTDSKMQQHRPRQNQAQHMQRNGAASDRRFSYQECAQDHGTQMSPTHNLENNFQSDKPRGSSGEYTTPPSRYSQLISGSEQAEDLHDAHDIPNGKGTVQGATVNAIQFDLPDPSPPQNRTQAVASNPDDISTRIAQRTSSLRVPNSTPSSSTPGSGARSRAVRYSSPVATAPLSDEIKS